jgi:hypothetical protein
MAAKPFIAARIPEGLRLKLEEHSKATGEGKTQAIINALSAYLSFTPEEGNREGAGDRLSLLEMKVAELEKLMKEPQQISLLNLSPAPTLKLEKREITSVNATDNKTQESARNGLNNREMSEASGIKYETVRSKHKHNMPIAFNGKEYLPVKEGNSCKWRFS